MRTRFERAARRAFTLIEVNLAMFIMAAGVLTMVALYPLGYRENEQSQEDVIGAVIANNIMDAIAGKLSDPELTWNSWKGMLENATKRTTNLGNDDDMANGWGAYLENPNDSDLPLDQSGINSKATEVLNELNQGAGDKSPPLNLNSLTGGQFNNYACAIVVTPGQIPLPGANGVQLLRDWRRAAVAVRVSSGARKLFAQPMYYTEVHFQGDFPATAGAGQ